MKPSAEEQLRLRYGLQDAQWMARARVPAQEMVVFCRQMAALTNTGVPIFLAMDILAQQTAHPVMAEVLRSVAAYVESGYYLSQAVAKFPKVFGTVFITLVRVGEDTGALGEMLELVALWLERDYGVRQKVKAALTYPTLVMILALGACYFLMTMIAPGFLEMFEDEKDLPAITRAVAGLVHLQSQVWFWILLGLVTAALVWVGRRLWDQEEFRLRFYQAAVRVPVVGQLLVTSAWARYFAAYSVMVKAGVTPLVTFPLAARASGDPRIEDDSPRLIGAVKEGEVPSQHMRRVPAVYPSLVAYSLEVTESVGPDSEMVGYLERFYRLETEHRIDVLSHLAEPLVLLVASSFVLTLMLSLMLPLYGQMSRLGS